MNGPSSNTPPLQEDGLRESRVPRYGRISGAIEFDEEFFGSTPTCVLDYIKQLESKVARLTYLEDRRFELEYNDPSFHDTGLVRYAF